MRSGIWKFAIPLLAMLMGGCATTMHRDAEVVSRLYNLQSGEAIELVLGAGGRNKSKVIRSSTTEAGESFTGELTTTGRQRTGNGINLGWFYGSGWSIGADLTRMLMSSGTHKGTGVLVGSGGTVIDLTYEFSGGNAEGRGKDNKGQEYRLQCCETAKP